MEGEDGADQDSAENSGGVGEVFLTDEECEQQCYTFEGGDGEDSVGNFECERWERREYRDGVPGITEAGDGFGNGDGNQIFERPTYQSGIRL